MEGNHGKGTVCVTGGTGFLGSWLIMRLLEHGYSVNTTIRSHPGRKKDVGYLTNLPGASEKLRIFNADLEKPETFDAAIKGCIGVFHVAHPMDFEDKETEETKTKRAINGTLGILQSCLEAKTVKRVIYTSSASTVFFSNSSLDILDENTWSDVDFLRSSNLFGASYVIAKTLTEKAALEFAEKHGLDVVSVVPVWINGPFLTPHCAGSVCSALALLSADKEQHRNNNLQMSFVHTDDVARAHIFLFEHPHAKGRYICSAVEITVAQLSQFLSARYSKLQIPVFESKLEVGNRSLSSKKLLDTGFKYNYGLEEMFDGAIESCKQKGIF